MKLFTLTLTIIALFTGPFQQPSVATKDKFDREHNATSRSITDDKALTLSGAKLVYFTPFYTFEGHVPREFVEPELTISVVGAKDLGDQPDLIMKMNGQKDGPYSTTRIVNDSVDGESFQQFVLPWKARRIVREITDSMIVDGQIGPVEFGISLGMIDQIKAMYSRMPKERQGLDIRYNKEDDVTRIFLTEAEGIRIKNARYFLFAPNYEYSGRVRTDAGFSTIMMLFYSKSSAEPEKTVELKIWADDKPIGPFTAIFLKTKNDDNGEQQIYGMKDNAASIIEAIANATKVKGSLGNVEFTLSPETISQIKLLNNKMQKK